MRTLLVLALAIGSCGCTRAWYRRSADRETYQVLAEHNRDPRWLVPYTSINPAPTSRLFDPSNPDRPPMPPDDPAANEYMRWVNGMRGYRKWHKYGDAPWIEPPFWRDDLPLDANGILPLTPDRSVELGVLNSREYQTALEDLYQTALTLTLNRFEFALRWFALNNTTFTHFGSSANELNTLTVNSNAGFNRAFAAGGQLLVDFANSFVFQFAGPDRTVATSNIMINFIQPLLRRAGRDVRLEPLTQAERNVLYAVRDFARFRKQFTFDITAGPQGYLGLLFQVQSIRNQEANLDSLGQNLRLHEALYAGGNVSVVQVDQSFQLYQQGRVNLLRQQTAYETALDTFKISLGLPPDIPIRLDDSQLAQFQLADPALTNLQKEVETFFAEYRELDEAPPLPRLRAGFERLKTFQARTLKFLAQIEEELGRWQKQLDEDRDLDEAQAARQRGAQKELARQLPEMDEELRTLAKEIDRSLSALAEDKRQEGWEALQKHTRQELALADQLFVLQNQVRVYLIRLPPVRWDLPRATEYARANRFDLMNQRARVVDAWRQITVVANSLEAGLNAVFNANIATPPDSNNPAAFRASASSYQVGLQFDGPLNRQAERNAYRVSLINYQQARRAFMALDDSIQRSIRRDLRNLDTERLNFEIARQSLISAARQVEAARERLLLVERATDTNTTIDILNAINALLTAKTTLISSWVNYETGRVQLLLDLEALQLDAQGIPTDEHDDQPGQPPASRGAAASPGPEPFVP